MPLSFNLTVQYVLLIETILSFCVELFITYNFGGVYVVSKLDDFELHCYSGDLVADIGTIKATDHFL